jgi:hypothetical protein
VSNAARLNLPDDRGNIPREAIGFGLGAGHGKPAHISQLGSTSQASERSCTDRPKYASNNRKKGTPEEIKATAEGRSHISGRTPLMRQARLSPNIESASFPNWSGTEQKQ